MLDTIETSVGVDDGGNSQALSISSTSAQSNTINAETALVTLTVAAFVRKGTNPVAVATGADTYLMADVTYRLQVKPGTKLAFITLGSAGTAYITPGA